VGCAAVWRRLWLRRLHQILAVASIGQSNCRDRARIMRLRLPPHLCCRACGHARDGDKIAERAALLVGLHGSAESRRVTVPSSQIAAVLRSRVHVSNPVSAAVRTDQTERLLMADSSPLGSQTHWPLGLPSGRREANRRQTAHG